MSIMKTVLRTVYLPGSSEQTVIVVRQQQRRGVSTFWVFIDGGFLPDGEESKTFDTLAASAAFVAELVESLDDLCLGEDDAEYLAGHPGMQVGGAS